MKVIPLSGALGRGMQALVDDEDYDRLSNYKWYARQSKDKLYVERQIYLGVVDGKRKAKSIKIHRDIMGVTDRDIQVDHKDRDTFNNTKSNLRLCNQSQNNHNQGPNKRSLSGHKNISKIKNLWRVMVNYQKTYYWVGLFPTLEEAIKARDDFRRQLLGEFA